MMLPVLCKRYGLCFIIISVLLHTSQQSWLNKFPVSSLPDGVDHVVAACQEDNMFLQCKNRYNKLFIKDVYYGRDNANTCQSKVVDTTRLCDGHTPQLVKEKIHIMCSGENKCKVPITPEFLEKKGEEICPEVRKYLRVAYSCQQRPNLPKVCPNGCGKSCWPECKKSCCAPPDTGGTCSGGCPGTCAPMCTATCCESKAEKQSSDEGKQSSNEEKQSNNEEKQNSNEGKQNSDEGKQNNHEEIQNSHDEILKLPSVPTICPNNCPSDCAPTCDESCCLSRKTTVSQFNQPPPTFQYNRIMSTIKCESMCTPPSCQPSCDPSCCISSPVAVGVAQCPAECAAQCAPTCQPSCCSGSALPPPPPPLPSLSCPGGCSQRCAPLCQPTCCQSSQIMQSQSACPAGCSAQCAPLCQPTCCQSSGSLSAAVNPMLNPMSNPMPNPMMNPMMTPIQTSYPYRQPPIQAPQQPLYSRPLALPQQRGCPVNCILSCLPKCPKRCCAPPDPMLTHEIQQRQTYRQMLQHFREKQVQQYLNGKK